MPVIHIEEDDECKIITKQTIFDHIREKSKNFPVLVKSTNAFSPSPEVINLARKRSRENWSELQGEVGVKEQKMELRLDQITNPTPDPEKENQDRLADKEHFNSEPSDTKESLVSVDLTDDMCTCIPLQNTFYAFLNYWS